VYILGDRKRRDACSRNPPLKTPSSQIPRCRRMIKDIPEAHRFRSGDAAAAWARFVAFAYGPACFLADCDLPSLAALMTFAAKWDAGELRARCVAALEAAELADGNWQLLVGLAYEHGLPRLTARCAHYAWRRQREVALAAAAAEAEPAGWHQPLFGCFSTPLQSARCLQCSASVGRAHLSVANKSRSWWLCSGLCPAGNVVVAVHCEPLTLPPWFPITWYINQQSHGANVFISAAGLRACLALPCIMSTNFRAAFAEDTCCDFWAAAWTSSVPICCVNSEDPTFLTSTICQCDPGVHARTAACDCRASESCG